MDCPPRRVNCPDGQIHRIGNRALAGENARRPVSRVLYANPRPRPGSGDDHSSGTPVTGRLVQPTRTTAWKPACATSRNQWHAPSLFGLAPGGVYHAAAVADRAVRSYRTLSPLPAETSACAHIRRAVCFLWHFPWGRPRRVLPGTVFPWSPDFPPFGAEAPNSGHPTVWRIGLYRHDRRYGMTIYQY